MFAIQICTKNRKADLVITLRKIESLINRNDVACVVFDDGSTDGTFEAIRENFPKIELRRNETSKGLMYCRNRMLNETTANFAVSLDDDAHFLSENPLEKIKYHFDANPKCGAIAFRLWWNKNENQAVPTTEKPETVKGFVGCGHAWRIKTWREIENYPEWFEFYGEEDFAGMQLFKKGLTVDYVPKILVQHRVDLKTRSHAANDAAIRYRRLFRSGWYLYFIFLPASKIPKRLAYTLFIQLKIKVFGGNFKLIAPLSRAIFDVIFHIGKLLKMRKPLTQSQFEAYSKLPETKVFWNPKP